MAYSFGPCYFISRAGFSNKSKEQRSSLNLVKSVSSSSKRKVTDYQNSVQPALLRLVEGFAEPQEKKKVSRLSAFIWSSRIVVSAGAC